MPSSGDEKQIHSLGDLHYSAEWSVDRKKSEAGIAESFETDKETNGLIFGPIKYEVLPRDHDKVPEPYLGVPDNAKFLVGAAKIVAFVQEGGDSITNDIDKKDLIKLRELTQKIWRKTNPKERILKTKELDKVINEWGEKVVHDEVTGESQLVIERMLAKG